MSLEAAVKDNTTEGETGPLKTMFTIEEKRSIAIREAGRAVIFALDSSCAVSAVQVGPLGNLWSGLCAVSFAPSGCNARREDDSSYAEWLRTCVRGLVAGSIAVGITSGQSDPEIRVHVGTDDVTRAMTCCLLLPYPTNGRFEYCRLFDQTIALLRDSATWQRVLALTDALEQAGRLSGKKLQKYLRSKIVGEAA